MSLPSHAGYASPFSFALRPAHADWMTGLPASTPLTALSLPGTHDSLTHTLTNLRFQCQNHSLATQLTAGVRYLDVRVRLRAGALHVYHQDDDTGYTLEDVLHTAFAFLAAHPAEALLMRLRDEGPALPSRPGEPPTADDDTTERAFNRLRAADATACAQHLLLPPSPRGVAQVPTLGHARGRILLLQDFAAPEAGPYGIEWGAPLLRLQDLWELRNVYDLPDKFVAVRDSLIAAGRAPAAGVGQDPVPSALFLSHLSAADATVPIAIATGPLDRNITGVNDLVGQWIEDDAALDGHASHNLGVVIMDFPGMRLIDAILARNESIGRQAACLPSSLQINSP